MFIHLLIYYFFHTHGFTSSGEEGEVKDDVSEAAGDAGGKMRNHPLISLSIINPDEIPDVPKNQFLYRAGPEKNDEGRVERNKDRPRSTVRAYTKSGRKIKGRGSLVRLLFYFCYLWIIKPWSHVSKDLAFCHQINYHPLCYIIAWHA